VEGPTDDEAVNALRARQKRNFLATLLLSQGVPMLLAGDEMGRTQQGNNNTYCQDNELSWLDWDAADKELISFTADVIQLRKRHPTFRRRRYFQGAGRSGPDIQWFTPTGEEMSEASWADPFARCIGALFTAAGLEERDERGRRITDDDFLMLLNAHYEPLEFMLPSGGGWQAVLDTARDLDVRKPDDQQQERYVIEGRSMALLRRSPR
jgi:isoamylase